jgi:hypothetical protein
MKWTQSRVAHGVIALVGSFLLACGLAYVAIRLSFHYFAWKYPHDGQDGLGALTVGVFVFPAVLGVGTIVLYFLQRRLAR